MILFILLHVLVLFFNLYYHCGHVTAAVCLCLPTCLSLRLSVIKLILKGLDRFK